MLVDEVVVVEGAAVDVVVVVGIKSAGGHIPSYLSAEQTTNVCWNVDCPILSDVLNLTDCFSS